MSAPGGVTYRAGELMRDLLNVTEEPEDLLAVYIEDGDGAIFSVAQVTRVVGEVGATVWLRVREV